MKQINIRAVGIYHPDRQVENDHFIRHFEKQDKDITSILSANGRRSRYISDRPDENSLTMAEEACEKALASAGMTGQDINLLIFSSATPEYLAPSNAIRIHASISGRADATVYDMNANCVGMIVAVEQASLRMLSDKNCTTAMIVGSEQMNKFSQTTNEFTLSNFGDAACAVILEKSEGEGSGFQDAAYYTNSSHVSDMIFPETGLSNIYSKTIGESSKRIRWAGGIGDNSFGVAAKLITRLLEQNGREIKDIARYFVSQLCLKNIQSIASILSVDIGRFEFVGDRYGYTGTSSPFVALYHAIQESRIHRGDEIIFWSVGTGCEACAILWKY
jgi:3-oxoacyl-[acyl-carrier-protein] synthase III